MRLVSPENGLVCFRERFHPHPSVLFLPNQRQQVITYINFTNIQTLSELVNTSLRPEEILYNLNIPTIFNMIPNQSLFIYLITNRIGIIAIMMQGDIHTLHSLRVKSLHRAQYNIFAITSFSPHNVIVSQNSPPDEFASQIGS